MYVLLECLSLGHSHSQFRDEYTLEQIMQSREIHSPLTKLQCRYTPMAVGLRMFYFFFCSPTSDGSAAAILCSENFVHRYGLESQAVEIVAMEMRTDFPSTFKDKSCMKMVST